MQPDERVLSSCDVTGLIKNSLSLCVHSAPCTRGHFYRPFGVFLSFLYCYALFASVFVRSEIQSLFHRAIVTLHLLELTSRGFAIVIFFVVFFLIVFFGFIPMPILVLVFIAAQTAAATALSLKAESLAVTHADLYPYHLWLIASSAEYSDRKTGSPGYVTRKEACLSLDSTDCRPTLKFATVLYLRCRTVDVRSVDCSARRSDDTFEPPNPPLSVPEACSTRSRCSHRTLVTVRPLIIYCNCSSLKSRMSEG
ncbi:hypothetical protein ALC57_10114 [Trachymyrmex cornetzi]|uniref:Uncharacterized protein n=1 Tax=Trachymyrmex cornetzi TaxID=471704 RepID=A0A151J4Q9_9HYME|nr:hypothetical protein ALC57_10114 [Trachymyrmex cornetzi]